MIVGSVCARGGSRGVPRKNLRPLLGKPLIAHAIACAQQAALLDRIVVSTDDEEIAQVARDYGAAVPFMRPSHLATDEASKWDVFKHLVDTLEQQEGTRPDILVDLDTGAPFRSPTDIDAVIEKLRTGQVDVVITAYEAERNPYFNMVEVDAQGLARIVKPLAQPVVGRQQAPPVYSLSPAVYAMHTVGLDRFEHWSRARLGIHVIPRERAIDIDTELDYEIAEFLMRKRSVSR